jgi:uncharacterized membrane protein YfcA
MDVSHLLVVVAVFLLAGGVKGVTGMGLPTVAVSLLGLWMAPAQSAALLVLPSLATNVAQCRGPHLRSLASRLWPGWIAIALVTAIAPGLGDADGGGDARFWLGLVLIAYGGWGLWRPTLPDLSGRHAHAGGGVRGAATSAAVGAATGLVTALTAVFVLPWVPWLQTLRLDKDAMVQALGLSFTVATLALAIRLQTAPMALLQWSPATVLALGAALAGAFAGMGAGAVLRARLAGPAFQRALFGVFVLLGLANLARAA